MSDKYAQYKAAQEAGGPCPICGWREGDGVQLCYYSHELGNVGHQNNQPAGLTAEQQGLYELFESRPNGELVYIDVQSRERKIAEVAADNRARHERHNEYARQHGRKLESDSELEEWIENYSDRERSQLTLAEATARYGSLCSEPGLKHMVHIFRPHKCGGHVKGKGPYHIACTGCDVEIKLWEHGIDYDIG